MDTRLRLCRLATQVGVHPTQVNRWVHGLHRPAAHSQENIAAVLGLTVAELFPSEDGTGQAAA